MEKFGILDCAKKYPNKVSGGERQRAAIAKAIINDPDLLFSDEPTGSLDHGNTVNMMSMFKELNEDGHTIIMVTHDNYCASFGNRIVYLHDKKIQRELNLEENQNIDAFIGGRK